ncbi:MAG: TIR domain-containing protein, partial [Pseudomonadota bacterium]
TAQRRRPLVRRQGADPFAHRTQPLDDDPALRRRQLRDRFANSKLLIVLIGEKTKFLTKFVKWEMEVALRLRLPIIGVNLNDSRTKDERCPPAIRDELAIYVPFKQKIIAFAMNNWPNSHAAHLKAGDKGPYYYQESTYEKLGLNS